MTALSTSVLPVAAVPHGARHARALCAATARCAVRSLHAELLLYPKPGLVSLVDNGSHADMNALTFMRSMFALRHYFHRICHAGYAQAPFATLRRLGIEAESRMLTATGGINTHRGAIFSLGMLCAAAGRVRAQHGRMTPAALQAVVLIEWGQDLGMHAMVAGEGSHGLAAAARHGASGARDEAAQGFPSVFQVALPAMQAALAARRGMRCARVDALFALMASMSDTNVYHRGGALGAQTVRDSARAFLDAGGTANPAWEAQALACHRRFVAERLSPGGAADLLAAACLVLALSAAQP